jgi:uncharacterized membrane protein YdjX (TVP38/TMEM64 family)
MTRNATGKIITITIVIVLIAVFELSGLQDYLTLSHLKESRELLAHLYTSHRASVIAAYMVIYIVMATLALPGAVILTLAGGALFGLWTGTLVVSFASSIGATLACLVSRFILGDWVQKKHGDRLRTVNEGIEREGAFYLFTLRLIPVFPFWLINLGMGLTKMPLRTFYLTSQIGMLPATIVFVNAGSALARIDSPSEILSPGLLLSLVLLGIFPIAARKGLAWYKSAKKRTAGNRS